MLKQRQRSGELKPVAFISRAMTPTERRYAQIEKEALAFTLACERLSDYLTGLRFHIETDHKPLVPLFSTMNLKELPLRVQRFRLRMMRYSCSITHVPGKQLVIAIHSRAPLSEPTSADNSLQEETAAFVNLIFNHLPATEERLEEITRLQAKDEECRVIANFCRSGWPDRKILSPKLKRFSPMEGEFSVEKGLLLRGGR